MGAQCNLHGPSSPTIMAHLKSSSISNHFFIFQKVSFLGAGRLLLLSPLSFVLAFLFLLALPSCYCTHVNLLINISFMRVVSFYSWFIFLIIIVMVSSLVALQIFLLPFVVATFFPPSYSPLKCLLSSFAYLDFSPLID